MLIYAHATYDDQPCWIFAKFSVFFQNFVISQNYIFYGSCFYSLQCTIEPTKYHFLRCSYRAIFLFCNITPRRRRLPRSKFMWSLAFVVWFMWSLVEMNEPEGRIHGTSRSPSLFLHGRMDRPTKVRTDTPKNGRTDTLSYGAVAHD